MQQYIWYLLIAVAVPGLIAVFAPAGKAKKTAGTATLVFASLVVLVFLGTIMSGSGRMMKSSAGLPADKAELQLRLTYAVQVGMTEIVKRMKGLPEAQKARILADVSDPSQAYSMAEAGLAEAITRGDESAVTRARIATLLFVKAQEKREHPRVPHPALRKASRPRAELPPHLSNPIEIAKQLQSDKDAKISALGFAMEKVFEKRPIPYNEVPGLVSAIETGLPFGWYRDNLLRQLYRRSPNDVKLGELIADRNSVYLRTFLGAIGVMAVGFVSTVIGAIVILIELALMARKPVKREDTAGLDVDMLTLYKVFIAWFCTQAAISMCLQAAVRGGLKLPPDPFNMAIVTAVTYLIANLPGLFYIYWFALKPRGLKFWDAMKFRTRTNALGPFKLVAIGYLGWCAAFPMVLVTALIAGVFMNSQGSENPVISQIMSAANAPDPVVILLFYLTIAVMAPICEETMFRGFIYGSLRNRVGVPLAILCSAMIFGLVHFDKGGILGLIAIGVVLAYVFERTRSLLPCMVTHGLWNGAMFTATLILFGTR